MTYRARYDFRPRDSEELELRKNETVSLLSTGGDDWWQVRNQSGGVGLVPKDYLQEIMYSEPPLLQAPKSVSVRTMAKFAYNASRDDELSLRKGDCVEILEKEGDGWWRGKVGAREGWFPANYVEEISGADEPSAESERTVIHRVVAMYSFNPGNSEELRFRKGDVLEVIDLPEEDPDWWEARHQGETNTGLIPRNYVEIIEETGNAGGRGGNGNRNEDSLRYPFCNEVWYHGKISRGHAEHVLRPTNDGQFLVRASETKPGDFSVSVKAPDCIKHFRVQILGDGRYGIGNRKFDTLYALIDHYRNAPIYTPPGGKVFLSNGVSQ